ncbi:MAG: hypothetical protein LBR30_04535 [Clostridioides sp.]|nr:hypothetical protein [Clostridioides sp.]
MDKSQLIQLTMALLGVSFGLGSYIRLIRGLLKNEAQTNFYSWIVLTILCVVAFAMPLMNGVNWIGVLTPFSFMVCAIIVTILSYIKSPKEKRVAKPFDKACLILAAVLFIIGLFGPKIATSVGIQVADPKFFKNVCMAIFTSTAFVPCYMRIKGIVEGNHEIPSSQFMLLIRNMFRVGALNVFNFFTLYGPVVNVLVASFIMFAAMYYNNKRKNEESTVK